jgi:hypothetical protein
MALWTGRLLFERNGGAHLLFSPPASYAQLEPPPNECSQHCVIHRSKVASSTRKRSKRLLFRAKSSSFETKQAVFEPSLK